MFGFKKYYFILALILFIVEILIAIYVKDQFVRPYVGDFLVVILIYFFVRTFIKVKPFTAAFAVLIFAYGVEFLQYLSIVEILGLKGNRLAEIIIGTSFSWSDMLAYTLGVLLVYFLDRKNAE